MTDANIVVVPCETCGLTGFEGDRIGFLEDDLKAKDAEIERLTNFRFDELKAGAEWRMRAEAAEAELAAARRATEASEGIRDSAVDDADAAIKRAEAAGVEIEQLTDALGQANIDVANMAGEVSTFAEPCQTDGCQFARAETAEAVAKAAQECWVMGEICQSERLDVLESAFTAYDKVREG